MGNGLPLANLPKKVTDIICPPLYGINCQEFSTFCLKLGEPQKNIKIAPALN